MYNMYIYIHILNMKGPAQFNVLLIYTDSSSGAYIPKPRFFVLLIVTSRSVKIVFYIFDLDQHPNNFYYTGEGGEVIFNTNVSVAVK